MAGVVQGRRGIIMGINRSGDKDRTRILIINFKKSILLLFYLCLLCGYKVDG